MKSPICYCIQEPTPFRDRTTGERIPRDLSSAVRYGRVEFILSQEEKPSLSPAPSFWKIYNKLKDFDPETDFIFWAGGDTLALGLAFAALRDLNFSRINFLRWERDRSPVGERVQNAGYYVPVKTKIRFFEGEQDDKAVAEY